MELKTLKCTGCFIEKYIIVSLEFIQKLHEKRFEDLLNFIHKNVIISQKNTKISGRS